MHSAVFLVEHIAQVSSQQSIENFMPSRCRDLTCLSALVFWGSFRRSCLASLTLEPGVDDASGCSDASRGGKTEAISRSIAVSKAQRDPLRMTFEPCLFLRNIEQRMAASARCDRAHCIAVHVTVPWLGTEGAIMQKVRISLAVTDFILWYGT